MYDLLEQFQTAAASLSFRLVDLDRSPGLARRYGISRYDSGTLEIADRSVDLRGIEEREIIRALLKLARSDVPRLCFVTGHGERDPTSTDERSGYSEVAKELEREQFEIVTLTTIPASGVPEGCSVVVVAGPSHDLLPGEGTALARYLREGGRLLLLADPDAPPSVVEFLRRRGIEAGNDLIVDEQNRFIGADSFMPQVVRFRTDLFQDSMNTPAILVLARTVRPADADPGTSESKPGVLSIAATSPDSWALVNPPDEIDPDVRFRRGTDDPGPLSVGVLASVRGDSAAQPPQSDGQLVVFGDSDFAANFYLNLLGNKNLFMSTIALLAEEPELVAERRQGRPRGSLSPIFLTEQDKAIFKATVVILPAAALLVGAVVAFGRRRRRGGR